MAYVKKNWQNTPSTNTPINADNLNHMEQGIYEAAETADYAKDKVDDLQGLVYSPLVAATAAAMTDTTKVYVYTGSEAGYTSGHWYYYNGSAWADGGVYNSTAFNTDTTLSHPGEAADAEATGNKIGELKSALTELQDIGKVEHILPINLMSNNTYADHTSIDENGDEYTIEQYALYGPYDVYDVTKVYATRQTTLSDRGHDNTLYAFYDKDGNFISRPNRTTEAVSVPANTKTVKFSIQRDYAIGNYKIMLEHNDNGTPASSYSAYFTPYFTSLINPLAYKKICAFGDSLAAMDNGDRNANTWIKRLCDYLGAIPYNRGIGSSCVTAQNAQGVDRTGYAYVDADGDAGRIRGVYTTQKSFDDYPNEINPCMENTDRTNTIPTDTDIVIIVAGTNDIGTTTIEMFKSAYGTMLEHIMQRVPNAKIFTTTLPFQTTYDMGSSEDKALYNNYRQAIKDVSALYGFECIDLRSVLGVNAYNYASYMNDTTHYNTTAGRKKFAECMIKALTGYSKL